MKCSLLLLNWKRPANVERIIRQSPCDEILVWDNSGSYAPSAADKRVTLIKSSKDVGLFSRYALGLFASHDSVLIQDDDILLPDSTIERLCGSWELERGVIHGLFGRSPRADGSYANEFNLKNASVAVTLTRALVCSKLLLHQFFSHAHEFKDVLKDAVPKGNGEDIILNYVARLHSGEMNKVYSLPRYELPAPHAIHARAGHSSHRTRLMRYCESWLKSWSLPSAALTNAHVS